MLSNVSISQSNYELPPISFLDGKAYGNKIALCTYPRTGNTMIRKYFQEITRIASGSLYRPQLPLSMQLQLQGMIGEGHYDDQVWLFKTHYPLTFDKINEEVSTFKAIVCVREPTRAIESDFNLALAQSQNLPLKSQNYQADFGETWLKFFEASIQNFKAFYSIWINQLEQEGYAVYIFKYEDLIQNPQQTLEKLFCFVLGVSTIQGCEIEHRIKQFLQGSSKQRELYVPRSKQTGSLSTQVNSHLLDLVKEELEEILFYFGYANDKTQTINEECTYHYEESKYSSRFKQYLKGQEHSIELAKTLKEDEISGNKGAKSYVFNKKGTTSIYEMNLGGEYNTLVDQLRSLIGLV